MRNKFAGKIMRIAVLIALVLAFGLSTGHAAREAKIKSEVSEGDLEASRLADKADELMGAGETDRAVKMLETIIEQYPKSRLVNNAYLALGKYYIGAHEQL